MIFSLLIGAFDPTPFWQTLQDWGDYLIARLPYFVVGLVIALAAFILARLTRRGIVAAGRRSHLDVALAGMVGRLAGAGLLALGMLIASVVIFPSFRPGDLIAGLGLASVAIGFALKDVLQNFVAGLLLLWQMPFRTGDQIRVRDFEGAVEEITFRSTQLKTDDGERVLLPNGDVYASAVLIRTAYDKRRVRLVIAIRSLDLLERARAAIGRAVVESEGVLSDPAPFVGIGEFAPGLVNFTAYFWTRPDTENVRRITDRVATGIKRALDEGGIAMV